MGITSQRFQEEKSYIDDWDNPKYSLQLHANNRKDEVGLLVSCSVKLYMGDYPYKENYARVK